MQSPRFQFKLMTLVLLCSWLAALAGVALYGRSWTLVREIARTEGCVRSGENLFLLLNDGSMVVYDPANARVVATPAMPQLPRRKVGSYFTNHFGGPEDRPRAALHRSDLGAVLTSEKTLWLLNAETGEVMFESASAVPLLPSTAAGKTLAVMRNSAGLVSRYDIRVLDLADLSEISVLSCQGSERFGFPWPAGDKLMVTRKARDRQGVLQPSELLCIEQDGSRYPLPGLPLPETEDVLRLVDGRVERLGENTWPEKLEGTVHCVSRDGALIVLHDDQKRSMCVVESKTGQVLTETPVKGLGLSFKYGGQICSDDGQWVAYVSDKSTPHMDYHLTTSYPRSNLTLLNMRTGEKRSGLKLKGVFVEVAAWPRDDLITVLVSNREPTTHFLQTWLWRGPIWARPEAMALAVLTVLLLVDVIRRRRGMRGGRSSIAAVGPR